MTLFTTDQQRDLAGNLKVLIARLNASKGEDRCLGADVVEALGLPATVGDPTSSIDCVLHIAEFVRAAGPLALFKVQRQHPDEPLANIARIMCARVLIIRLAKIERNPA